MQRYLELKENRLTLGGDYPEHFNYGKTFEREGISSQDIALFEVLHRHRELSVNRAKSVYIPPNRLSLLYWSTQANTPNWYGWLKINKGSSFDFVFTSKLEIADKTNKGGSCLLKAKFPLEEQLASFYGKFTQVKLVIPIYDNMLEPYVWVLMVKRRETDFPVTSTNVAHQIFEFSVKYYRYLIELEKTWLKVHNKEDVPVPTAYPPAIITAPVHSVKSVEDMIDRSVVELGCLQDRSITAYLPRVKPTPPKSYKGFVEKDDKELYIDSKGGWSEVLKSRLPVIQLLSDEWLQYYELFQELSLDDSKVLFIGDDGSGISAGHHYMSTRRSWVDYYWSSLTPVPFKTKEESKVNLVICNVVENSVSAELYPLSVVMDKLNFRGGMVLRLRHKLRYWVCTAICQLFEKVRLFLPVSSTGEYFLIATTILSQGDWTARLRDYTNEATSIKPDETVMKELDGFTESMECDTVSARYWLDKYSVDELPAKGLLKLEKKEKEPKVEVEETKEEMKVLVTDYDSQFEADIRFESDEPRVGKVSIDLGKLPEIEETLNQTKGLLDNIDKTTYAIYQRRTNYISGPKGMRRMVETQFGAQIATNAWFKMYEILVKYPSLLPNKAIVLFGAELPGAFISCVNHYATIHQIKWDWVANSLVGTDTSLTDQFGLIPSYPEKWLMTASNVNGDLTSLSVIDKLLAKLFEEHPDGADLYVSDIAVDVKGEWNKEEELNMPPQLGQILFGLSSLKEGGGLVVKMFTAFKQMTVSLLYLTVTLFEEARIFKPYTSRSRNSELYLVCNGFKGVKESTLKRLSMRLKNFTDDALVEVPEEFLDKLTEIMQNLYVDRQCQAILGQIKEIKGGVKDVNSAKIFKKWQSTNNLETLPSDKKLKLKK